MKNSYSLFIGLLLLIGWACMGCHPITKEETNISHPYEVFAINELGPPAGTYRIKKEKEKVLRPFNNYGMHLMVNTKMIVADIHMPVDQGAMRDELVFYGSPQVDSLGLIYDGDIRVEGAGDDWALTLSELCRSLDDLRFFDEKAIILPRLPDWTENVPDAATQLFETYFKDVEPEFDFNTQELYLPTQDQYKGEQAGKLLQMIPEKIKRKNRATEKKHHFTDVYLTKPPSLCISEPKECNNTASAKLQPVNNICHVILAYRKNAETMGIADHNPEGETVVFSE